MNDELSDEIIVLKICKGRLCLPSSYKVSNGEILFLTRNALAPSSLAIYTRKQWAPIRDFLLDKSFPKPRIPKPGKWQSTARCVLGNAEECIVEGGEIRISSHLVKIADLHSEALWIQGSDRIEIWNPRAFDEWKQNQE